MKQDIIKELKVCRSCGEEYEAQTIICLGARILRGAGDCPKCVAGLEAKEEAKRLATIATTRRQWRAECGIPAKFMTEDFSTFKKGRGASIDSAFDKCWAYAEGYSLEKPKGYGSLLLLSPVSWGTGKTHLACSIGHRILDRWNGEEIAPPVVFVSEPDIYTRIRETFNFTPEEAAVRESEQDILRRLITTRLLILDDLGKQKPKDPRFVQRTLFAIIDARYRHNLPIVVTTNLSQEALLLYLGGGAGDEASYDRLVEMCNFKKVEGKSYRRQ